MTNSLYLQTVNSPKPATTNDRSLRTLARAIAYSEGQFAIILAACNDLSLRRQIVSQLKQLCPVAIEELQIAPQDVSIYSKVAALLECSHPPALMISGLEGAIYIDRILMATNMVRDEFRKHCHFPLVLWVNDEIKQKLIRLAPDYKNWAGVPIQFETEQDNLINC
jgi:hypothetical protein